MKVINLLHKSLEMATKSVRGVRPGKIQAFLLKFSYSNIFSIFEAIYLFIQLIFYILKIHGKRI